MKRFDDHIFDRVLLAQELQDFRDLLDSQQWLSEREDILPFFRSRRQLSAFVGVYNTYLGTPNRIAFELRLEGDFVCDLAVGDKSRGEYCFVEFEDARQDSIFTSRGRAIRSYSPRFNAGFSQIVDWFYKLSDLRNSQACEDVFAHRNPHYSGLLVIGRNQSLQASELARFRWRRYKTFVDGHTIQCVTFDELYDHLNQRFHIH